MRDKKRKGICVNKFLFTLPTPLEVQLTKNNYSIAEQSGKVKEIRGFRPVFQSR